VAVRWINRGSNVVDRQTKYVKSVLVEDRFTYNCPIEYEYEYRFTEYEYEYRFTEYEYDLPGESSTPPPSAAIRQSRCTVSRPAKMRGDLKL
jgi:hypothetical protein